MKAVKLTKNTKDLMILEDKWLFIKFATSTRFKLKITSHNQAINASTG